MTNTPCSLEDYHFAMNVYKSFNCKNLYEYTILYNHTDTLILAEIMMVYRKVIQDHFQMDINHFLGIPGLSFNIMLKISKVKLELISDPKICDFLGNQLEVECHLLLLVEQNLTTLIQIPTSLRKE